MKKILLLTAILFILNGCKNDNSTNSLEHSHSNKSSELSDITDKSDSIVNPIKQLKINKDVTRQIKQMEQEKIKVLKEEKEKSVREGKTCDTILEEISDAILRLNSNGDNDKDLEFINNISDDAIYLDCIEDITFQDKVNKLYDSWK